MESNSIAAMSSGVAWKRGGMFLASCMLWLLSTPYQGIDNDAVLYMLAALNHLRPAYFVHEMWFMFGSQDDWTVFSPILAAMVSLLGMEKAAMTGTLIGGVLFVIATQTLTRRLTSETISWLATMLLASVVIFVSLNGMLHLREGFVTSRAFSIPLAMLGVQSSLRSKWILAGLFHSASLALHPIMGLLPALASVMYFSGERWLWGWILAALVGLILICAGGEFGFLATMDTEWRRYVVSPLVFIQDWVGSELSDLIFWISLLLFGYRYGRRKTRTIFGITLIIVSISFIASLVAGNWFPVVRLLQAQVWRGIWFGQILGVIAATDFLGRMLLRSKARYRPYILLLILMLLAGREYAGWILMAAYLLTRLGSLRPVIDRIEATASGRTVAWVLSGLLTIILLPGLISDLLLRDTGLAQKTFIQEILIGLMRGGCYGVIALTLWIPLVRWPRTGLVISAMGLMGAGAAWDSRSIERKYEEGQYSVDAEFSEFRTVVAPGAVVYWPYHPEKVWFELGSASYASHTQATGLIFSRERTMLLNQRAKLVDQALSKAGDKSPLDSAGLISSAMPVPYEPRRPFTGEAIRNICQDSELDFVAVNGLEIGGRFVRQAIEHVGTRTISTFLYRCRDWRERGAGEGHPNG